MTEIKIPALVEMDIPPILAMAKLERLKREDVPTLLAQMLARPGDEAHLLMNQFQLFSIAGNQTFALEMFQLALAQQVIYRVENTQPPALRLLALMGAGDTTDNTPLDYLIENSDIRLDLLFIVPGQPLPDIIPDHDVAIVALGESSKNQATIALMETLISHWPRPVLNHPRHIRLCARDRLYQHLKSIQNLLISPTLRFHKLELARIATQGLKIAETNYPMTIRPIDTQAGIGLSKIATPEELNAYLQPASAQEFFVSSYIDYRHADGLYRKIRIALIDGLPYACHLAISEHWIAHYKNSGMSESVAKRAEEEKFMRDFDSDFALRHGEVLREIAARIGLDYVVIDCAETRDGKFILFEADNRGWVHATDPLELFAYKQVPMRKTFDAFRTLLFKTQK
ncbi:MAG: RimK family alpha-L-glutamate ligase [Gallionella sp.]